MLFGSFIPAPFATTGCACSQPETWSIAAAFDLAANGLLPVTYPQLPATSGVHTIPPSLLKAIGWVESRWQQYTPAGRPLVSSDFGYGIMQITSGMAGASGNGAGAIDSATQSLIATSYRHNIAFGAQILAEKWAATPMVGDGDPAKVENWYYAIWAYNGWGWVNNPNNPRFSRVGTPTTDPSGFPYQEDVLYFVTHPPHDADGNPLWASVHVTLPSQKLVGSHPGALHLTTGHLQAAPTLSAIYRPNPLSVVPPSGTESVTVRVTNTGSQAWPISGSNAASLTYHVFAATGQPWAGASPFSPGVLAFGREATLLPNVVSPGQSVALHMSVHAPSQTGTFLIAWDLQLGGTVWFSEIGATPRVERLVVTAAGASPVSTPTATPAGRVPVLDARYVADTSVPDGSVLLPRQTFTKGWLLYNAGRTGWVPGFALQIVSGPAFHARRIDVTATRACRTLNLMVPMRAPGRPGLYKGVWRMTDLAGHGFGDPVTVVITVRGQPQHGTPTPTPTAVPRTSPTPGPPAPTATPVG